MSLCVSFVLSPTSRPAISLTTQSFDVAARVDGSLATPWSVRTLVSMLQPIEALLMRTALLVVVGLLDASMGLH